MSEEIPSADLDETLRSGAPAPGDGGDRARARRTTKKRQRLMRRHPDIEVARLLVKRGFVEKQRAVDALRTQKARAKAGKARVGFLQLLVKTGVLDAARLDEAQDEIRRNTYICESCDARAVILAGSQTRAGACPRCGAEISVDPASDPEQVVPVKEFQGSVAVGAATSAAWRGGPAGLIGADPRRLAPGQVVFEKYRLADELGRGAMGVVFRARHLGLDKDVALKVLLPTEDNREHQVARFRREAAAVQKLRHPGIIAVHDFGGEGDLYYLTMDLVEGGESLHRALKRRDAPLPLKKRLELLAEVAHAVGHAHERGVVHRDLKPANVLIDPRGRALVADFGLAKDEDAEGAELTRTHDRLGTPLFMAPEQIRRGASQVDGRADVWALGVMLFVCATGRYPFRSRTVMDLYLRIMKDEPDWTGDRYSAPDRPALTIPTPVPSSPSSAPSERTETSKGEVFVPIDTNVEAGRVEATKSSSGSSSHEATEVDVARVRSDGSLPKTLPPRGAEPAAPPPFAPPPELEGKELPRDLKRIIECALSKQLDERYPTAEELALDLERFLSNRPVEARSPSPLTRLRRTLGRRRVAIRIAQALTVLVVVMGGAIGAQAWRRSQEQARGQAVLAMWSATGAQATVNGYETFLEELARRPELADSADGHLYRGWALTRLLRWDEAAVELGRAAALADELGDDAVRGRIEVERAHLALIRGDARAALDLALLAASRELPDARPPVYAALAALALGDPESLDRAERVIDALVRRPGASAKLIACHARLALRRGHLDEARARLPARAPNEWFDLTLARAAIALAERDMPAAEALHAAVRDQFRYQALRAADPEVTYYNGDGLGRLRARDLAGGLKADLAAAALSPWHPGPLFYAGRLVLGGYCDPEASLPLFLAALERDPFHPVVRDWVQAIHITAPEPRLEAALRLVEDERALRPIAPAPALWAAALHLRLGHAALCWHALDLAEERGGGDADLAAALVVLRAAALRHAQGEDRAALTRAAAGMTFVEPTRVATPLEAALRVEVARLDLEDADHVRVQALLEPVLASALDDQTFPRAQDAARLLLARAWAARGDRARALELLKPFRGWDAMRPTPPELTPEALRAAPELQSLRGEGAFQELLAELEARRARPR